MPIFDYECVACHTTKEHITFHPDQDIYYCPKCGKRMKRNISNRFSFNFAAETGVWEKGPDGQEHYKGKGGIKVPIHKNGTPVES